MPWPHALICSLFLLCFAISWRCQATVRAKTQIPDLKIASLETNKFIAGPFMGYPVTKLLFGAQAVLETSRFNKSLTDSGLTVEQKKELVIDDAFTIVTSKIPGKLITTPLSENTYQVHQVGIVAHLMGKAQALPIFKPSTLLEGVDIYNLDFSTFWKGFTSLCQAFKIPLETLQIVFAPQNFCNNLGCKSRGGGIAENQGITPVPAQELELHAKAYLIKTFESIVKGGTVFFREGIALSFETGNLLPIEKGLPIERENPPSIQNAFEDKGDDPFIKLANEQIKVHNSQISKTPPKGVKAPKASPKEAQKEAQKVTPNSNSIFSNEDFPFPPPKARAKAKAKTKSSSPVVKNKTK